MNAPEQEFVFGPFRLLQRGRLLLRDGKPVPLKSRAFDLLALLLEGRDGVVPRDELLRRIWPGGPVHENNLAVHVSSLRRILGTGQNGQPYIATIAGRGFQFVAPVVVEDSRVAVAAPDHADDGTMMGNILPSANRLIGRAEIIAEVTDALEQSRLVSLTGPSGIGKTRVAHAVALQSGSRLPHGSWLIDLAPLRHPGMIAAAIATTLGLPATAGEVTPDGIARQLRQRGLLLLLDNCEHLLDGTAALAALLIDACPQLRILATSLERLNLAQERVCHVETLTLPPIDRTVSAHELLGFTACELFVERARTLDRGFVVTNDTAPIIAEICRRLDGIPLAIELAASRQAILGLEQIRRGLDDRFRLLIGGERLVATRHMTLLGAHEWSYALLPERAQRVLARLSVFAGGFSLAETVILAHDRPKDFDGIVDDTVMLVERSLVAVERTEHEPRYRLLDSTRAYAARHLADQGDEAATRRAHALYFADLFETAERRWETTSTSLWHAGLLRELDNLRAALAWCFAPGGDARLGQRLCAASIRFWHSSNLVSEYRRWLDRAIATPPEDDDRLSARLWLAVARTVLALGTRTEAADRAIALARGCADADTLGRALALKGEVLRRLGDPVGAAGALTDAMALLLAGGAVKSYADASQQLAIIRFHQGDFAGSRALNADALARYRATGHESGIIACLIRAANDQFSAARIADAIAATTEALALSRRLRNDYLVELTLGNLASYEVARGEWRAAWLAGMAALPVAIGVDDRAGVATIVQTLAEIAAQQNHHEAAACLLGYSEAFFEAEQEVRDPLDDGTYDRLVATLGQVLDREALATCRRIGAKWTADIVLAALNQLKPFP
jgi:predicted ATPase/DNA-binding winged helix-turn-helix (wHTH) protein